MNSSNPYALNLRNVITLLVVALVCQSCARQPATLTFVSDLHTPSICGFLPSHENYSIERFAFYVSDLEAYNGKDWESVALLPLQNKSNTQSGHTALIDLAPQCDSNGQTKATVALAMSHHRFAKMNRLRFTLGVPFLKNHANPVSLPVPLNEPSMFWSWQRGHKFVRFDLIDEKRGQHWNFHLGSVGCDAESAMRSPTEPCQSPNLLTIELDVEQQQGVVFVEVLKWLQDIQIENDSGCMFNFPEEPSCARLINNIQQSGFRWVATNT